MSNGAQTKPNHSHNENYTLWPILFKTSPALHSFSLPYYFHSAMILHPLLLGLVTAPKSLIPHPLLWLLFPHPFSSIPTLAREELLAQAPEKESDWLTHHTELSTNWLTAIGSGGPTRPISSAQWSQVTWYKAVSDLMEYGCGWSYT